MISVIEQEMNGSPGLIYLESVEPGQRRRPDHADLRVRHQPRPRAGRRAEPAVARGAAPARGRDAAGRARRQGALELPAVHDPVVRQPGLRPDRARRLRVAQRAARDPAHARRRPGAAVRHRAGDARSGSTRPSWSASTSRRTTSTTRSGRRTRRSRRARSATCRSSPNQPISATVVVAGQLTTVEQFGNDRAARQHRRLDRPAARRRPHRARRPELRHLGAPERQALDRHRRAALADRQRAGDRRR